jgi:hypothetical protein
MGVKHAYPLFTLLPCLYNVKKRGEMPYAVFYTFDNAMQSGMFDAAHVKERMQSQLTLQNACLSINNNNNNNAVRSGSRDVSRTPAHWYKGVDI